MMGAEGESSERLRLASGSVALTGVGDGHDNCQQVTHASTQTIAADGHHLDLIGGVG